MKAKVWQLNGRKSQDYTRMRIDSRRFGCRLRLILILILFAIMTVSSNPGKCPVFPLVSIRDKSCYETSNCNSDMECADDEKCCENPCGVTQCFKAVMEKSSVEKCPQMVFPMGCKYQKTIFCFKGSCDRCCYHREDCNPYPSLLNSVSMCEREACKNIVCKQQGSLCQFNPVNKKAECACRNDCPDTQEYVCATNGEKKRTFLNRCRMEREACTERTRYKVINKSVCKKNSLMRRKLQRTSKSIANCDQMSCPKFSICEFHPFTHKPRCRCPKTCSFRPRRICASNGQFFINQCLMQVKACNTRQNLTMVNESVCMSR